MGVAGSHLEERPLISNAAAGADASVCMELPVGAGFGSDFDLSVVWEQCCPPAETAAANAGLQFNLVNWRPCQQASELPELVAAAAGQQLMLAKTLLRTRATDRLDKRRRLVELRLAAPSLYTAGSVKATVAPIGLSALTLTPPATWRPVASRPNPQHDYVRLATRGATTILLSCLRRAWRSGEEDREMCLDLLQCAQDLFETLPVASLFHIMQQDHHGHGAGSPGQGAWSHLCVKCLQLLEDMVKDSSNEADLQRVLQVRLDLVFHMGLCSPLLRTLRLLLSTEDEGTARVPAAPLRRFADHVQNELPSQSCGSVGLAHVLDFLHAHPLPAEAEATLPLSLALGLTFGHLGL